MVVFRNPTLFHFRIDTTIVPDDIIRYDSNSFNVVRIIAISSFMAQRASIVMAHVSLHKSFDSLFILYNFVDLFASISVRIIVVFVLII